ncbi:MAG: hypothetical protein ACD_3C00030G0002 [uncultured bacterium (gcode 4)]|uniref:Uncharacterized protein n=1 Tax=uncultured bacterium (gcode 4) TaxID=1234023 RepID=K2FCB4_9BACT|nr:MAG: hypothetical protein ACD_3C00030G0002 [uncultured bacterium (gcode 4)]
MEFNINDMKKYIISSLKSILIIRKTLSILMLCVFSFSNLIVANAEPFYFLPNLMSQIRSEMKKRNNIWEKLEFLDQTYEKMTVIENVNKKFILSDIKDFKRNFIYSYLRDYTEDKYLTWTWTQDVVKKTRKYYQAIKIKDITSDIHPNFLAKLENKIREKPLLDEESPTFKAYIYVLYSYLKNKEKIKDTTESVLSSMWNFGNSSEFLQNNAYYESKFKKFYSFEKPNLLSKNDFTRIYSHISSNNISPWSDYMKWFLYWYATYKKVLWSNSIVLDNAFKHSQQAYPLSCEANSAKDLVNYYNSKFSQNLISEDVILSNLPSYTWAISKDASGSYVWWDPSELFVWQLDGKQSSNPNNFTWYWVYAAPIIKAINPHLATKKLLAVKTLINEKKILESIINEHPLVFWYITPVVKWKKMAYETRPTIWKTASWKTVNWYLWEHTWIMVWVDIDKAGKIENIYYYEWKKDEIQKMPFALFLQTTSFFNEMIVIKKTDLSAKIISVR